MIANATKQFADHTSPVIDAMRSPPKVAEVLECDMMNDKDGKPLTFMSLNC